MLRSPDELAARTMSHLMNGVAQDDWGRISPSVYETARVHQWAPHLPDDAVRADWLLSRQGPDGLWGEGPLPYRTLPSLSVVAAFLDRLVHHRDTLTPDTALRLTRAVDRGLAALAALPGDGPHPDTAAIELLVPLLMASINRMLGTTGRPTGPRLGVIHGLRADAAGHIARRIADMPSLRTKFHHCFEVLAPLCPPRLLPAPSGLLGGSPAATAAWLATTPADADRDAAAEALRAVSRHYRGRFPETAPLAAFERLWVLAALHHAGLLTGARDVARKWLAALVEPCGVRGAPGLDPDADDTAIAVHLAVELGGHHGPDLLAPFHTGDNYSCYVDEDTASVTTNAHVLIALTTCLPRHPEQADNATRLARWLVERQHPEGWWTDKWHASPLYATSRVTRALARSADPVAVAAVRRAAAWATSAQQPDGSWGVWGPTAEETAYGAQILLNARQPRAEALDRANSYLLDRTGDGAHDHPPRWHDKTLYAPAAVIVAELTATAHLLAARHRG